MAASHCPCLSGLKPRELRDAAGIFCTYVCDKCEAQKRKEFNPEIFKPGTRYAATGEEGDIDTTDIPEATEEFFRKAKLVLPRNRQ